MRLNKFFKECQWERQGCIQGGYLGLPPPSQTNARNFCGVKVIYVRRAI